MHRRSMTWEEKCVSVFSLYAVAFVTVIVSLAIRVPADPHFTVAANALSPSRTLYAVNQSSANRGSISVYDIDRGSS
jgi:hypothetical protein